MDVSDSERISTMRSAVLIQYTRVTDGRTDRIGVAYARYSIHAVQRKNGDDDDDDDNDLLTLIFGRLTYHAYLPVTFTFYLLPVQVLRMQFFVGI